VVWNELNVDKSRLIHCFIKKCGTSEVFKILPLLKAQGCCNGFNFIISLLQIKVSKRIINKMDPELRDLLLDFIDETSQLCECVLRMYKTKHGSLAGKTLGQIEADPNIPECVKQAWSSIVLRKELQKRIG
jgi:hypothetical protein